MYLQRIRVPDFRVLKNVDISFEKEFKPSIFPIGSLNGGGKSTLLQLIFVLLHCSNHPDRIDFLKNLIEDFRIDQDSDKRVLAIMDIWNGYQNVELEFFSCKETYIKKIFKKNSFYFENQDNEYFNITFSTELQILKSQILNLNKINEKLEKNLNEIINLENIENKNERIFRLRQIIRSLQNEYELTKLVDTISITRELSNENFINFTEQTSRFINKELEKNQINIEKISAKLKEIEYFAKIFTEYLSQNQIIHICDIYSNNIHEEKEIFICHLDNLNISEANSFLSDLSNKVFLAAHISQIFLFLASNSRKSLFKTQVKNDLNENNYYLQLKKEKIKLPGFFTYDFMNIDILIKSFTEARDQDFIQAIETGEYGVSYKALLNDLNAMLINKKINLNKDFSGINFKRNDDDVELYPEDLSHGELKRLCIYMWLKYNKIENAIVLMDEIEIAFHPDWQYQIVRDLEQWSPTNQYILATHSYDLCEAVTPAHVKLLPPKLINPNKSPSSEI